MDHFALLHRIVVHETNRRASQVAIVQQLAQQQLTGVAGPVNQHAAAGIAVRNGKNLAEQPKGHATPGQQHQHDECVNQENCARETLKAQLEKNDQHADDRAGGYGLRKGHEIVDARIAPDAAIDAKEKKRSQPNHDENWQSSQKQFPCRTIRKWFELDRVRGPVGQHDQDYIEQDFENAPFVREVNEKGEWLFARRYGLFHFIVSLDAGKIDAEQSQRQRETGNQRDTDVSLN